MNKFSGITKIFLLFIISLNFQNSFSMDNIKKFFGASQYSFKSSIERGDVELIKSYLKSGCTCNTLIGKESALVFAVAHAPKEKKQEVIKVLLEKTAHSDEKEFEDNFVKSVNKADQDSLRLLLKLGIGKAFFSGRSFSSNVYEKDNLDFFELFISLKLIKNFHYNKLPVFNLVGTFRDSHDYNLLTYAIGYSSKKIIKYLLSDTDIHLNTYDFAVGTFNNIIYALAVNNDEVVDIIKDSPKADWIEAWCWLNKNRPVFYELIKKDKLKLLRQKRLRQDESFIKKIVNGENKSELPESFEPDMVDNERNNILHLALERENFKIYKDALKKYPELLSNFNLNSISPLDMLLEKYLFVIKRRDKKNYNIEDIKALKKLILNYGFGKVKDNNGNTLLHLLFDADWDEGAGIVMKVAPILLLVKNRSGHTPIRAGSGREKILGCVVALAFCKS